MKEQLNEIFNNYCQYLVDNDIKVVMPTFYPQRGGILEDLQKNGVECYILGGKNRTQLFEGVTQYGLEQDTAGMSETKEERDQIVSLLPEELQNKKLLIHAYTPYNWDELIKEKFPNTTIVSCTSQNTFLFFEEKQNLEATLKKANLEEHFIPSRVFNINEDLNEENYESIYKEFKNTENNKMVIQRCGEGHQESGGGKGTYIVNSLEDFIQATKDIGGGYIKVARFIDGAESNLSFFCSTTIKDEEKGGILREDIKPQSGFYGEGDSINEMFDENKKKNSYVIVGKSTLKCVSSDLLTSSIGNGVGNDVGYIFSNELQEKIKKIGTQVGEVMASCGKSGLAGCDLIITAGGEIYINEINDRQQGPTEQMSKDAEENNLPSLIKLAFLSAHCKDENFLKLVLELRDNAEKLSNEYLNNTGNFYIKLNSTHDAELVKNMEEKITFAENLESGFYEIVKDENGEWKMNPEKLTGELEVAEINTDNDRIVIKIDGVIKKGTEITPSRQMLRIEGKAVEGHSPFVLKDGKSILNEKWEDPLSAIYSGVVKTNSGVPYQELNPLTQKRLEEKYTKKDKSR